jgi:hypothetical protein
MTLKDKGNDLASICEETAHELLEADGRVGGLIAHLDEHALWFESAGVRVEITLTYGGPAIWLEVAPRSLTLRGQWWGQAYSRRLDVREDTIHELLHRA